MRNLVLLLVSTALLATGQPRKETALDRYVAKADPAYHWSLASTLQGNGVTGYVLDMTSQTYLTAKEVNRTEWKHWVTVVKPEKVESDIALLMITGGSNDKPAPNKIDPFLASVAQRTKSVTVELRLVPASGGESKTIVKLFGGQGTINVNSWSPDNRTIAFVSYRLKQ